MTAPIRDGGDRLLLGAIVVALLLPFLAKPFHVDDPFYLWVAERILSAPLDFYGLQVNWYGYEQPLAQVMQNPPLVSFYMAAWALVFGTSEVSLHAALALPALGLAFAVHALAGRLTRAPGLATLLCFATPVVLVSATSLMSDVPTLALYCAAVFLWIRGIESERRRDLWLAGLCAGLCALTKYFGITLLPLLAAHGLFHHRRAGRWLLPLCVPVVMLALYEWYTASLYGQGMLAQASFYALERGEQLGQRSLRSWIRGTIYAGGCVATLLLFAPFAFPRNRLLPCVALALPVGLVLFALGRLGDTPLRTVEGVDGPLLAHAFLFTLAAAGLLGLLLCELARDRSPATLLLSLWVAGTLLFASLLNWTTSARAVLPLVPPLVILLVRRIQLCSDPLLVARPARIVAALATATAVSLGVAHGDQALAISARQAAESILAGRAGERIWFEGHWGFQHYMQEGSAQPIDHRTSQIEVGDWIAVQRTNANARVPPASGVELVEQIELPLRTLASTLSGPAAGFYSSVFGAFPYTLGAPEPEQYLVLRATRRFRFEHERGSWPRVVAELAATRDWQGLLSAYQESGRLPELVVPAVRAHWALGQRARAAELIEEAARRGGESAAIQHRLAKLARELGQEALSIRLDRAALALDPDPAILNDLAWTLATTRDPALRDAEGAIALAEQLNRGLGSRDPNYLDTLAIAYAAAGRIDDAARTEMQASLLAGMHGDAAQSLALLERAERLRAGDRLESELD